MEIYKFGSNNIKETNSPYMWTMAEIDYTRTNEEENLESVSHFTAIVEANKFPGKTAFYRGQKCQWGFEPSIARTTANIPGDPREFEKAMLVEFKNRYSGQAVIPQSDIEWLALAQHEGMPTRLLDWSRDPFVALYFAVKNDPGEMRLGHCQSGQVMIYLPENDRIVTSAYPWNPWEYSKMVFILPEAEHYQWNKKLEAQRGCFSLHFYNPAPGFQRFDGIWRSRPTSNTPESYSKMIRINIPTELFPKLKTDLEGMGYNSASLKDA